MTKYLYGKKLREIHLSIWKKNHSKELPHTRSPPTGTTPATISLEATRLNRIQVEMDLCQLTGCKTLNIKSNWCGDPPSPWGLTQWLRGSRIHLQCRRRMGRSPGGRNGNLLQYSSVGNPMERGAWQASLWGRKESDRTEHAHQPLLWIVTLNKKATLGLVFLQEKNVLTIFWVIINYVWQFIAHLKEMTVYLNNINKYLKW